MNAWWMDDSVFPHQVVSSLRALTVSNECLSFTECPAQCFEWAVCRGEGSRARKAYLDINCLAWLNSLSLEHPARWKPEHLWSLI